MDFSTIETVTCKGREYKLYAPTYWHVAPQRGTLLYHNVFNHEGFVATISLLNRLPEEKDTVSPYSYKTRNDPKENLWERVRIEVNIALPTRIGAMFLVAEEETASVIATKWFPNERRNILRARVISGSTVFGADSCLLDGQADAWEANACKYWSGATTASPIQEFLVDGAVYFPDWRLKPFGLGAGLLPEQ